MAITLAMATARSASDQFALTNLRQGASGLTLPVRLWEQGGYPRLEIQPISLPIVSAELPTLLQPRLPW
jgi:hypothetical protein